jgi:hypothetical protein
MQDKGRKWHAHVITAYRMTDSQFTELQGIQSVAVDTLQQLNDWVKGRITEQIALAFGSGSIPGAAYIIPEALHFNIELSNEEEGRSL